MIKPDNSQTKANKLNMANKASRQNHVAVNRWRHWVKILSLGWLLIASLVCQAQPGKVVLIIDDMGYNQHDVDALNLPGPITYAILPHTPFAKSYAKQAHDKQRDVMLHIPMESLSGKALGPGGITVDMNQQQVEAVLASALAQIPFAIGVNNHMGSLLTQMDSPMTWTMNFLYRHQLFFVDSKTSKFSLAEEVANKAGVTSFHRHVFIDNDLSPAAMEKQLQLLIRIAQKYRRAIGIAHPYPETIKFLKQHLSTLSNYNVELVSISTLLPATANHGGVDPKPIAVASAAKSENKGTLK